MYYKLSYKLLPLPHTLKKPHGVISVLLEKQTSYSHRAEIGCLHDAMELFTAAATSEIYQICETELQETKYNGYGVSGQLLKYFSLVKT